MAYPAAGDYYKAVQAPARAFTVPKLQAAEFVWDSLGPTLARGSSAVVFQAAVEGKPQALRCYIRNDASSRDRYSALDAYLAGHDLSPCVSGTTWLDGAIQVNHATWPVLTMEWIDGRTLNEYVDFLVTNSNAAALATLAARWRELVALLQGSEFAHGDLQHGNVMVDQDGRLRLVDFDGVWIPQLARHSPPTEFGHPNYQHPAGRVWDRWLDTFSALVIYLSLVALTKDPGLWLALYNSKNLLFAKADFFPPFKTEAWKQLAAMGDPQVDELARRLQECCDPGWVSDKSLEMTLDQQAVTPARQPIPVEQRWWEKRPTAGSGPAATAASGPAVPPASGPAVPPASGPAVPPASGPAVPPGSGAVAAAGSPGSPGSVSSSGSPGSPGSSGTAASPGSAGSPGAAGSPSRPWSQATPAAAASSPSSPPVPASSVPASPVPASPMPASSVPSSPVATSSGAMPSAAAATAAAQAVTARIAAGSLPAPPPLSAPLGMAGTGPMPQLSQTMVPPGSTIWWTVPGSGAPQEPPRPVPHGGVPHRATPYGPVPHGATPYGPVPPAPQGYVPLGPMPPAPGAPMPGPGAPVPPARTAKPQAGPAIGAVALGLGILLLIIGAASHVAIIVIGGLVAGAWGMWKIVTGTGNNTKPPGQT